MIGAADTSAHAWKFHQASQDGKLARSRMTVSFLYGPPNDTTWGFRRLAMNVSAQIADTALPTFAPISCIGLNAFSGSRWKH